MDADNQYTRIADSQVTEKTGRTSEEWNRILDERGGQARKGADVVAELLTQYGLSKYWARTLYIRYQWERGLRTE